MNLGHKVPMTGDGDVIKRHWLPVDFDPVRPSGVSSTDGEHDAAIKRAGEVAAWLTERGFPAPVMADSGNGAHLLYRIDVPNDETATALVKGCLTVLDTLFSDDNVMVDPANFNAARIWKLYGTHSRKGDNTAERPHRLSTLVSVPDVVRVVPIKLLEKLCSVFPEKDQDAGAKKRSGGSLDLRAWLAEHGIAVRSERPWQGGILYSLRECPFSNSHRDGAFVIQFPSGAVYAGCHHASCGGGRQRWPELKSMFPPTGKNIVTYDRKTPDPGPENHQEPKEGTDQNRSPDPTGSRPVSPAIRSNAETIVQSGDPMGFILDVFSREHVGDRVIAECLLLSVISQSVRNTNGLHVAISGNSGKGKSHACRTMINLVPEQFRIKGTVSNKALYYHAIHPGTVLLFDDIALSDDLLEVLKSSTANFREPIEHRTLTNDRQVRTCSIPERCVWWLAKVETAGDDQIMNRMLCIWIDDSQGQDTAVLDHLKAAEAREVSSGDDPDVAVCRAIFDLVKEETLHIRIPFAEMIHFSGSQNRRNPGMLFDLIKCHARLFSMQRERDPSGSILATREDFGYARELYLKITGETGAQETKLTRNEVAALSIIATMGLEVFTIKHLQDALGLSYHQVYRMLKGYQNSRGSYQGILDKCPAVSYIDTTVVGDLFGIEVKRREHYFSFDPVLYRTWSARSQIWLDDEGNDPGNGDGGDHDCISASPSHQTVAKIENEECQQGSAVSESCTVESTSHDLSIISLQETQNNPGIIPEADHSTCDLEENAKQVLKQEDISRNGNATSIARNPMFAPGLKPVQTWCNDANAVKVSRKRSLSRDSLLPGLLHYREFTRLKVPCSKCDLCHEGSALFWCKEKGIGICEWCFTTIAREGNAGEGVK